LNSLRLLVMRNPEVGPHADVFDALLARTPDGAEVDFDLPHPKWWFLHHLVRPGFLLHGSNERAIAEFETRPNFDAHNERRVDAVFASDDAISGRLPIPPPDAQSPPQRIGPPRRRSERAQVAFTSLIRTVPFAGGRLVIQIK
jgi:hypothetical protein